jgi:hypothetical protein
MSKTVWCPLPLSLPLSLSFSHSLSLILSLSLSLSLLLLSCRRLPTRLWSYFGQTPSLTQPLPRDKSQPSPSHRRWVRWWAGSVVAAKKRGFNATHMNENLDGTAPLEAVETGRGRKGLMIGLQQRRLQRRATFAQVRNRQGRCTRTEQSVLLGGGLLVARGGQVDDAGPEAQHTNNNLSRQKMRHERSVRSEYLAAQRPKATTIQPAEPEQKQHNATR